MEKRGWWILLLLIPLIFRPTLGLLLVFFLPGLAFALNFFKDTKLHEKIALSIALSICLTIAVGFLLNMTLGLKFWTVFPCLVLLTIIPLLVYFRKKDIDFIDKLKDTFYNGIEIKKPSKKQVFQLVFLIICLLFLGVKVYQPHFGNPYPIHFDEWSRVLETTHIIEQETFNNRYNPQFVGHPDAPRRLNPGFQFLLSQFYILSGTNVVTFFQFLPALFAMLTGFIIFSFLRKVSNYWTGIFAIIVMSFMKTNDNTLGIAFLVALTMTFPLLYAMFYAFHNAFEKKRSLYILFASFIYFTVLVIHEQTGAAFFPIVVAYLIINFIIFLIKNRFRIPVTIKGILILLTSLVVPLFSAYVARGFLWHGTWQKSWEKFLELIVWQGTNLIQYPYNFRLFYGPILFVLAIIGVIMILRNININAFIIWSIIAVGQVINYSINHVTYLSYIERVRHHAVLGLIPLTAFGLYSIIYLLSKILRHHREKIFATASIIIVVIMAAVSITYADTGKYLPDDKRPLNGKLITPIIEHDDYRAIKFLKEVSYKNTVLADPKTSAAIYPISTNYVIASSQNPYDGFGGGSIEKANQFFSVSSCLEKQAIAYQHNVQYILSKNPINCENFDLIYSEDNRYIYELK